MIAAKCRVKRTGPLRLRSAIRHENVDVGGRAFSQVRSVAIEELVRGLAAFVLEQLQERQFRIEL
jgi:hypothetical protein